MNYMEQLAQMLGVELEEEFNLEGIEYKYKFTKDGLFFYYEEYNKWYRICDDFSNILTGKYEIVKRPILDEIEREHLSNIIKPFRDKLKSIIRLDWCYKSKYNYIQIEYDRDLEQIILKSDTLYNNMKLGKEYTLEELGL